MLSCVIHVLCLTAQKGMALILAIPLLSYLLLLTFVELFPSAGTTIWQSKETSNAASTERAGRTHSTEKKILKNIVKAGRTSKAGCAQNKCMEVFLSLWIAILE